MEENFRRYPIGIQNFEDLRNNDCVYVDKTELIYRLTHTNKVYFLSRPRRFGKSLLVSTLEAYFLGKKELFQGLAMETLEKDWTVYPVLHFDFSVSKYITADMLSAVINRQLLLWEKIYQREEGETTFSLRLKGIIQRAYTQTGKPVVILVDEYDAPMLDSNNNTELQIEIRDIMRDFFSPLKAQGQYIRFLFITGISKFSQMSIFSELNNLQNISMRDDYSAICGITEQELRTQLKADIEMMAQANGETYEEACLHLKQQYDGYHFSEHSEDIYNPFSLFNAFAQKKYANFWFSTGKLYTTIAQIQIDDSGSLKLRMIPCIQDSLTPSILTEKKQIKAFYHYLADISNHVGIDEDGFFYPYKNVEKPGVSPYAYTSGRRYGQYFDDVDLDLKSIDIVGNLQ